MMLLFIVGMKMIKMTKDNKMNKKNQNQTENIKNSKPGFFISSRWTTAPTAVLCLSLPGAFIFKGNYE
jgi:hypothetical protein